MKNFCRKSYVVVAVVACFALLLFLPSQAMAAKTKKKAKKRYQVSAKSAILVNTSKTSRLYGKNVHTKVLPASTTKVMTALVVLEKLPLDKMVTVSKNATGVQPTKAGLIPGEKYSVYDLLHAALMQSANDATVVLAEAVAGSEWKFVQLMNQRAKQLGARHTKFANSNGLPTKTSQYSTAYDMYLILKAALKYPVFREILTRKSKTITSKDGRNIALKSYNKLLFKNWKKDIYGKTGYTRKAQQCFLGYAQNGKNFFIIGVFGCSKRWQDIRYILTKYGGLRL